MLLAKESLMEPLDMHELQAPSIVSNELRLELFEKAACSASASAVWAA